MIKFFGCMRDIKELLKKQIDVYLSWNLRCHSDINNYREWLELFCEYTEKADIVDVTDYDVDLFIKMVDNRENSLYRRNQARKAIFCLRRYYMARSKNGKIKLREGRPPALDKIAKVKEYRRKGLTFRDIGKILDRPASLIFRWANHKVRD